MAVDPHDFFEQATRGGRLSPDDRRRLLELLWEHYSQKVFLFACARLGNVHDARDLCHDTFVKAMEWFQANPDRRPPKVNFPGWLLRIAWHLIIDHGRRPHVVREWPKPHPGDEGDEPPFDGGPDPGVGEPLDGMIHEEELAALRACMDELPERKRRVVVLRDIDGRPCEEIASEVGMLVNTVRVTLHRARKALRECVERRLMH
jgi:RNA polymerase sigma factor (sigma-70 family)